MQHPNALGCQAGMKGNAHAYACSEGILCPCMAHQLNAVAAQDIEYNGIECPSAQKVIQPPVENGPERHPNAPMHGTLGERRCCISHRVQQYQMPISSDARLSFSHQVESWPERHPNAPALHAMSTQRQAQRLCRSWVPSASRYGIKRLSIRRSLPVQPPSGR